MGGGKRRARPRRSSYRPREQPPPARESPDAPPLLPGWRRAEIRAEEAPAARNAQAAPYLGIPGFAARHAASGGVEALRRPSRWAKGRSRSRTAPEAGGSARGSSPPRTGRGGCRGGGLSKGPPARLSSGCHLGARGGGVLEAQGAPRVRGCQGRGKATHSGAPEARPIHTRARASLFPSGKPEAMPVFKPAAPKGPGLHAWAPPRQRSCGSRESFKRWFSTLGT